MNWGAIGAHNFVLLVGSATGGSQQGLGAGGR